MKPYMLFTCDCKKTYRIDIKELKQSLSVSSAEPKMELKPKE